MSLKLWPDGKRCEDFPWDLEYASTVLEFLLIIPRLPAIGVRTVPQIREGASKANTATNAHVVLPGDNAREVPSPAFDLVIQENRCARMQSKVVFRHSRVPILSASQEIDEVLDRELEIRVILRTGLVCPGVAQNIKLLGAKLRIQSCVSDHPNEFYGCRDTWESTRRVVVVIKWCIPPRVLRRVVKVRRSW